VLSPMQRRVVTARRTAAALGYNECVTYSVIDQASAALFGGGTDETRLENPISSDMSHMRPDLLPGLLQAAARNQARGFADMALFEVGPAFSGGEPGEEQIMVSGLLVGGTFTAVVALSMYCGRQLAPHAASAALGALTACYGVGQILGPVVTARLLESSGSFAPGLLGAAAALIGAAVLLVPLGKVRF